MKSLSSVLFSLVTSFAVSAETLTYSQNADIAVPAGFDGEIVVEGKKVQATFEGDANVALRLTGKAQFVKLGTGTPVLRASRGANAGTVEIGEGSAKWIGPSGVEAPGAFNVVKVRSGASLVVDESPVATRHAYVFRGGVRRTEATDEEKTAYQQWTTKDWSKDNYKAAYNCTYEAFDQGLWNGFFQETTWPGGEGTREGVLAVADGKAIFNGRDDTYPAYYYDSTGRLWLHYRALFVVARKGQKTVTINQNVAAGKVFVDGIGKDGNNGAAVMTNADWNLDVGFHEIAASSYFNGSNSGTNRSFFLSRPVEFGGDDGRWESGLLWHGACCNALVVEAGGSVSVTDGQALGVAQTDGCAIEGSVSGGAGSVMALLSTSMTVASPENWFSLGVLADFAGTVELGKSVRAYVPANVTFAGTVDGGEATVAFGAENAVAAVSSFDGTAVVPNGVTIPAGSFAGAVRVIGTGTLAVSNPADAPESFSGNLAFDSGDVRLGPALNPSSGVTLGGVGTLAVDARARYEAALLTTTGFDDWLLCGQTAVGKGTLPDATTVTFDKDTKPMLNEDGTLTLTYDTGKQVHGVFMDDLDLTANSCVELDFDMNVDLPGSIPAKFSDHGVAEQAKAGTFMMLVANSAPGTFFGKELYGEGSYGFRASFYEGGSFAGVYNGFVDDKLDGFPTEAPIHVNLRVAAGVMSVTLSGTGGTQSYQADVSDALRDGKTAHLALLGSTDWWDNSTTLVTSRITLSNLRVSHTNTDAAPYVRDTAIDVSKTGWTVYDKPDVWTTIEDKDAFIVIPNSSGGGRWSICNTPVPLDRPWKYTWKAQHSAEVGSGTYVYQSFYLQGEGPTGTIVGGSDNPTRPMKNSASYGFSLSTGHANGGSDKNAFIWLNGKMTTKPTKDDWIKDTWTRPKAGSTVVNTVRYDGQGGLSLAIESEGATFATNLVMTGLADLSANGAKWYITHVGYNASGTGGGKVFAYDTDFRAADYSVPSPAEVRPAVEVAAGADQTISLGDYGAVGDVPSVAFPSVTVGDGAEVTVATAAANAWASFSTLTVSGAMTLTAGANARLSLETVVATQNGSAVTLGGGGTFVLSAPVRIVVPKAKAGDVPRLVLDYKNAVIAGRDPVRADFTVVYDDGTPVPEGYVRLSKSRRCLTVDVANRTALTVIIN